MPTHDEAGRARIHRSTMIAAQRQSSHPHKSGVGGKHSVHCCLCKSVRVSSVSRLLAACLFPYMPVCPYQLGCA